MRYKVINTNLLVELVKEEEKIISSEDNHIVRGYVKEIGSGQVGNGKTVPMEVRPDSFLWFDKRKALNLPFAPHLYLLDQNDTIVIEED